MVPYTVVILKKNSLKHLHSCRVLVAELQYIIDNIIYLLALIPGQPGSVAEIHYRHQFSDYVNVVALVPSVL